MKKILLMAAAIAFFGNLDVTAQETAKKSKKVKASKTASKKEEAPKFEMVKVLNANSEQFVIFIK